MKLLAWDTSSKVGAIAAIEWGAAATAPRIVSEWMLNVDSMHSERLLWGIHQVLESSRWKLNDLDGFAVGIGPGSFTGLRIGVTTARTLAHTLNKPLLPLSSLAALARPVASWAAQWQKAGPMANEARTLVVASTDACKGELFALWGEAQSVRGCVAVPESNHPALWQSGVEECVITPDGLMEDLSARLAADRELRWVAVGEGRSRYSAAWERLPADREIRLDMPAIDHIQGRQLGQLAWEAWQAGLARPALDVHPRYVRASDAELKLKAGLLAPAPRAPEGTEEGGA